MSEISLGTVLNFKWPDAVFSTHGDKILDWSHPTQPIPTEVEIAAAKNEFISFQASIIYQKRRAVEYPSIEDQLDAIWKGGQEMEEMRARIMAVKEKYPNPKEGL